LKTGHLEASGYGLTGSAIRDGVRRTIVINGMESMAARAAEGERMLRLAFQSFDLKTIAPENVMLPEQKVWLGQERTVPVSLAEPMLIAGHKAAFDKAKTEIVLDKALEAPVKKGDRVGRLVVTLDGRPPVEATIIAEADVKRLGFFGRAVDGLSALISGNDG
jgi:D-alanyl-D-alanine carboxypeptidase (penicillin-binding protein 5/6)